MLVFFVDLTSLSLSHTLTHTQTGLDKNDPAHNSRWVVARTEAAARAKASELLGVPEREVSQSCLSPVHHLHCCPFVDYFRAR